jgi:CubicO group peptidase (beta-lactamase class C family)
MAIAGALPTVLLLAAALGAGSADSRADSPGTHADRAHADRADAAVRAFVALHAIPAAHVTVLRGDAVLLKRGYGTTDAAGRTPDAASVFPVGSISKQFTAAAIVALADAGRLRLDAPVGDYLPEWFADEPALRVLHLLTQTSGLADFLWLDGYRPLGDDAATPLAAYVALGAAEPRRFAPGTRWAYSNTNYKALALIAERVGGRPFYDVLAERVLRPAGIEGIAACHALGIDGFVPGVAADGTPRPLDASAAAYIGDGGLCANAAALTQWVRRVLASKDPAYTRLRHSTRLADGTEVPYGFGVSSREFLGRAMVWHGGNVDSHSTMLAYVPDDDLSVVILLAKGYLWPTELMPALIGAAPPTPAQAFTGAATEPARGTTDARGAAAATAAPPAGRFEDGLFRYEIAPRDGALVVTIDLIGTFEFVPAGEREWIARELPSTFRIRLPENGARDRFELDWGEVRSYARRVAD